MEEEEWFKKTYGADVKIKTNDEGLRERLKAMKDNNLNFLDETSMIQNDMQAYIFYGKLDNDSFDSHLDEF